MMNKQAFRHLLFARVSQAALAWVLNAWERAAKAPKGSVVWPDGSPVLSCDVKIAAPYKLVPRGDFVELQVV